MKKKPNTKLRDLLKSKKAKICKLSELSKTVQNRLAKLNLMLDELIRGKNVQNRRLATWLTEEEYESFESDWESQQQIREELQDKPSELQRYEDKLKEAIMKSHLIWKHTTGAIVVTLTPRWRTTSMRHVAK